MSVSTNMYALKPIITHSEALKRNVCMYEMKNIYDGRRNDNVDQASNSNVVDNISEQTPLAEVAVLEARQEKILAQLAELKEQILSLCDVVKQSGHEETSSKLSTIIKKWDPISLDIVVNCNPLKPCYSIQALQRIWKDVDFTVKTYTHSGVEENVPEFRVPGKIGCRNKVHVSLIWSKVDDFTMLLNSFNGYPIIGESNFLRYLVRSISTNDNEDDTDSLLPKDCTIFDKILDLSHTLHYKDSPKEVSLTLATIAKNLENNSWLSGTNAPGIADVAVWSSIKRASLPKLPANLSEWYQKCDNAFLR